MCGEWIIVGKVGDDTFCGVFVGYDGYEDDFRLNCNNIHGSPIR